MIEAENVALRIGTRTLLSQASFAAQPGEFIAVLGANGVGKTTLRSRTRCKQSTCTHLRIAASTRFRAANGSACG